MQDKYYMVDLEGDKVYALPQQSGLRFTTDPAKWDHGMIYCPPGAKLVKADNAIEAKRIVEEFYECVEIKQLASL